MAFDISKLTPQNTAKGDAAPTKFTYYTQDQAATVDTSGYFSTNANGYLYGAFDLMKIGDIIERVTVDGAGALVSKGEHQVITKNTTTKVIDVTDTTAATITNTD